MIVLDLLDHLPRPIIVEVDLFEHIAGSKQVVTGQSRAKDAFDNFLLSLLNMHSGSRHPRVADPKRGVFGRRCENVLIAWVVKSQRRDAERVQLVLVHLSDVAICVIEADDMVSATC